MASKNGLGNFVPYLLIGLVVWNIAPAAGCDIPKAICSMYNGYVSGTIYFSYQPYTPGLVVTGEISGLRPGPHGFHVHQFGDFTNGCDSTGEHYNPRNETHGAPSDAIKHVGDLGNIIANDYGVAYVNVVGDEMQLCGPTSILGRGLVVHAGVDDLGRGNNAASKINGNSGARIGCCVIGIAKTS